MILGVGTGKSLNEVPATGIEWPGFKERFARLRKSIALIRRLWPEERVTFEGQYYRTENATIYDARRRRCRSTSPPPAPIVAKLRRTFRRRLHLHERQAEGAISETLLPNVAVGLLRGFASDFAFLSRGKLPVANRNPL